MAQSSVAYLKCKGVDVNEHSIQKEIVRIGGGATDSEKRLAEYKKKLNEVINGRGRLVLCERDGGRAAHDAH